MASGTALGVGRDLESRMSQSPVGSPTNTERSPHEQASVSYHPRLSQYETPIVRDKSTKVVFCHESSRLRLQQILSRLKMSTTCRDWPSPTTHAKSFLPTTIHPFMMLFYKALVRSRNRTVGKTGWCFCSKHIFIQQWKVSLVVVRP